MSKHATAILVICLIICAALVRRRQVAQTVRDFFGTPGPPINLAFFRIVLFGYLFLSFDPSDVVWFSRLPKSLLAPPVGLHHLLPYVPIDGTIASAACILFRIACLCAALGLVTRVSAWCVVALGLYALGIPEFYGKVDHYHHVLWFSAILAVSPCADVLALDALLAARGRADLGDSAAPPGLALRYSLPLRFVWCLMGMIYLFPGFWKLWSAGLGWASPQHMAYQLYQKWIEFPGWRPIIPIDRYPPLLWLCGLGTILFETSFIFLVFMPRVRPWLALAGLAFHNMTNLFMRIPFVYLQVMYVSLFDWDELFAWLGARLFPKTLRLQYNGSNRAARRLVASVCTLDILKRMVYVDSTATASLDRMDFAPLSDADLLRALITRIPALWLLWPLTYLGSVVNRMQSRYALTGGLLARSEAVARPDPARELTLSIPEQGSRGTRAIFATGGALWLIVFCFGIAHISSSWPFACYPTFDYIPTTEVNTITVGWRSPSGRMEYMPVARASTTAGSERLRGLVDSTLSDRIAAERHDKLAALLQVWSRQNPALAGSGQAVLYRDTLSTLPQDRTRNPIKRELLLTEQYSAEVR